MAPSAGANSLPGADAGAGAGRGPTSRGRLPRLLLGLPPFGWWALFFVVPLVILVVYSFGQIDIVTFKVTFGWTFDNYETLTEHAYQSAIVRSVVLAAAATLACLFIGFPAALYISRRSGRAQLLLLAAVLVPFWTSFIVRTYAWVDILRDNGLLNRALESVGLIDGPLGFLYSPGSVGLVMVYTYLPLMILPLFVALERIDPRLEAAAADLGASRWRVLRRVTVPLAAPGIFGGCLLVGIPALGEYVVPAVMGGGKTLLFGNLVAEQFLNVGNYPLGAAIASSFMALITVLLVVTRRQARKAEQVL